MSALSFPVADPVFLVSAFALDPGTEHAGHHRGRRASVSRVREQVWTARYETGVIGQAERIAWEGWAHRLDGGLGTFLGSDTSRGLPQAYWALGALPDDGVSPWDGVASVTAVGAGGAVSFGGVPAGLGITRGDRIGLVETIGGRQRRGYFEAVAGATANGAGVLDLTVTPFPAPMFSTAAVAQFDRPQLELRLVRDGFSVSPGLRPTVSFSAVQVL